MVAPRRYPYLYEGEVTRRDDPDGLGRVKVLIPGIVEPETPNWAWPMGSPGGGSAQRGTFEPPAIGATVMVQFKLGELDYPYYLIGPWGEPGGTSDVPTDAEVEGENRQNAVTEDAEWTVQRDSRSGENKVLVRHKSSGLAILVDAELGQVALVDEAADQALVRGTEYRAAEVAALGDLVAAIDSLVAAMDSFGSDPTFSAAFSAAAGIMTGLATTTYPPLKTAFTGSDYAGDATAYLSEDAFTE